MITKTGHHLPIFDSSSQAISTPTNALWRVLEITDVHVPRGSDCGHTSPARFVRTPHIKEEGRCSTGHGLGVMDHELAINIPVNVRRPPDNPKIVRVALVESGDFRILEV